MRLRPLFLLAVAALLPPAARAQEPPVPASPPADTSLFADPRPITYFPTDGSLAPDETDGIEQAPVSFSPVFYAPIFWLPSTGFGLGLGVNVQNIGFEGSSLLIQAIPSQRTGQYGAWFQTRSPYTPGPSLLVGGFYETTSRHHYYGVGPASRARDEVGVEKRLLEGELRASYGFFPQGRLRVQAHARYQRHDLRAARDLIAARRRLDADDARRLAGPLEDDAYAVAVGGEVLYDSRTNLFNPQRGLTLQLGATRTEPTLDGWGGFNRVYASANAFRPIMLGDARIAGRVVFVDTDAGSDVPFVLLPVLDSRLVPGADRFRFAANDLLVVSGETSWPVLDLLGAISIDAVVSAALYSAYDDVYRQFTPAVTFARTLDERDRYPLRPAAGLGFRLYSYALEALFLDVTLGASPEYAGLAAITLVSDLRLPRAILRGL